MSAEAVLHATHVAPADPQVASERVLHVVPLQQPLGHDVPSHTHRPARQRWPAAHGPWPPQLHWPAVQPSARFASHAEQACPPVPHVVALG